MHTKFVCKCAEGGCSLPFIRQLWFSGDGSTEKAQSENMELLQHRGRGQCLFTGQTPRVRDINIRVSSRRRRTTQRVTWGEGKLRRVFGETSKWYLTESAVCSNVYCTNDLPEHHASLHVSSSYKLLVNRLEWLQPRNYLRLTNLSSITPSHSRAFLNPCLSRGWV